MNPNAVAARFDADVPRGGELVAVDRDVVLAAAADRERGRIELVLIPLVEDAACRDHQPARPDRLPDRSARHRRAKNEALLRQTEVAGRGADDPQDKKVEEDQERNLERKQHALVCRAREDHARRAPSSLRTFMPAVLRRAYALSRSIEKVISV